MGLFDGLFGTQQQRTSLPLTDAVASILVAAAISDGDISDAEQMELAMKMSHLNVFRHLSQDQGTECIGRAFTLYKRVDESNLLRRCAEAIPDDLHGPLLANVCDVLLKDGFIEDGEREFLDKLAQSLQLSGDEALTIVEVMIAKHQL